MPEFLTPVDVANRALQHLGARRIDPLQGFQEDSRNASAVSFCYGKLRRAELQRNVWTKATRKAAIRPIDQNTLLLAPTLFDPTVTYFQGSVVTDQSGTPWESRTRDNLGNDPQNSPQWQPYFGPLTAEPYDSSKGYFAGELIYTLAGDGTYNVWRSRLSNNNVHPAMPDLWDTLTTFRKDEVVVVYPAWSSLTTYTQGQTVSFGGNIYSSLVNGNLNNSPASSSGSWAAMPTLDLQTQQVPSSDFSPNQLPNSTPIDEWNEQLTYGASGFVIFNANIYLAIATSTGQFPNAAGSTFWAQCTGGVFSMSLIDVNLGNNPANAPALWASGTTYAINNLVGASNGFIYKSLTNGNAGHDPTLDFGTNWTNTGTANPWTTVFVGGSGNRLWIQIGGASFPNGVGLTALDLIYPLGAGPVWQTTTRNVYRLPANWLGKAPQDPKAGRISWLGAPGSPYMDDWEFDGDYIVTYCSFPIIYRFVADIQNVAELPDMFCEGLAARIALETCEELTQSQDKLKAVGIEYDRFMGEARTKNMIEQGVEMPPLDDYIAARL